MGGSDNDTPSLSINDVVVNEGAGTATFTVTLSATAALPVSVAYGMNGGTASAGSDFTLGSGSLTFAPGVTSMSITVPITNDGVFEGPESFNVNLSAPVNATIADALGVGTIRDDGTGSGGGDDDRPAVASVSSPTVVEGGNLDFSVTLNHTSTTPTTVTLAPASGSAILGTDTSAAFAGLFRWRRHLGPRLRLHRLGTRRCLWPLSCVCLASTTASSEPSETFSLSASTPQNAAPVVGTGTINDNDGTPTLSIAGPALVNEAAGTVTYTVTLSNPSASTVSVNYGTANGSATAGSDYTATSGSLSFAPGETSKTFTVAIANDAVYEGSEAYSVSLSAPTNATLGTASVSTAIADDGTGSGGSDDDTPTLSVNSGHRRRVRRLRRLLGQPVQPQHLGHHRRPGHHRRHRLRRRLRLRAAGLHRRWPHLGGRFFGHHRRRGHQRAGARTHRR